MHIEDSSSFLVLIFFTFHCLSFLLIYITSKHSILQYNKQFTVQLYDLGGGHKI